LLVDLNLEELGISGIGLVGRHLDTSADGDTLASSGRLELELGVRVLENPEFVLAWHVDLLVGLQGALGAESGQKFCEPMSFTRERLMQFQGTKPDRVQ
jgi:hypothetical protein